MILKLFFCHLLIDYYSVIYFFPILFLFILLSFSYPNKMAEEKEKPINPLDEADINLLMRYGRGPYAKRIQDTESDISKLSTEIKSMAGVKESDTGLAQPSYWDIEGDKMMMQMEHPLQVARCTKIINPRTDDAKNY